MSSGLTTPPPSAPQDGAIGLLRREQPARCGHVLPAKEGASSFAAARCRMRDYAALTRPRIGLMVLLTVAVSGAAAHAGGAALLPMLAALAGTFLLAAGSGAMNQLLERRRDAFMSRTVDRPLPSGRLGAGEVGLFAAASSAGGIACLILFAGPLPALIGALTWLIYVCVYTPLKAVSPANTAVGAVAGALPVLIGWTAAGGGMADARGWALFALLLLWQFPHFMAIAWIYRHQYAAGGMKMLTVVDPSGRRAGLHAAAAALALLPVSLVPAYFSTSAVLYPACALLLGVGQFACAAIFGIDRNEKSARRLLAASLIYLPALMAATLSIPD